jgi:mono/diheme cytochrome c family protein
MYLARWLPATIAGLSFSVSVVSAQRGAGPSMPSPETAAHTALVQQNCLSCHNDKSKVAGLSLQGSSLGEVPENSAVWEKVLRKVQSGDMPPPTSRTRPEPAAAAAFAAFLETTIDRAAAAKPNPGRPAVHRLNRAEYSNAIRDLLAVDVKPGDWLPVDDSGYGFDNIADVLSTSPALLERYMIAGRRVSRLAIGDLTVKPVEEIYDARRDPLKGSRNERLSDDLPFDSRAGISVDHYFPLDAEYEFEVRFVGLQPTGDEAETYPYRVRLPIKAGLHAVGVTSPRENLKVESETPGRGGGAANAGRGGAVPPVPYPVDIRLDGKRLKRFDFAGGTPEINRLIIGGPYGPTGRGTTASRSKIFVCRPATAKEEPACAREILTTLARRAFRRPVAREDIQPLYAFYEKAR